MRSTASPRRLLALSVVGLGLTLALVAAGVGHADSTPVGPLPAGPVASTVTTPGQLVAVALPHASPSTGLVWRVARAYDSHVVKELSEADVGSSVVVVFKVVGRGSTVVVFALTRGDASSRAVKSVTQKIRSA
jgi:hypothetical protein